MVLIDTGQLGEAGLADGPPQVDLMNMAGQCEGPVAHALMGGKMNLRNWRPWLGDDGRSYMDRLVVHEGKKRVVGVPTTHAATLRYDEWKHFDTELLDTAKAELQVFGDLEAAGLVYGGFNAMASSVLMYQDIGEINAATVSMDGLREHESDRPEYSTKYLPLPIIHKDWHLPMREIEMSRTLGQPLDTTIGELAAQEVSETAEKLTLGTYGTYTFGGGTIYGYTNFTSALTKTITSPATAAWVPKTTVDEIIAMKAQAIAAYHRGPYFCYMGTGWDSYLDVDYSDAKGGDTFTLRQRIAAIDGIDAPKTVDHLTGYTIVLVEKRKRTVRAIVGQKPTTIQWESNGGWRVNFKTVAILIPQLRADQNGNTGIVVGTV